MTLSNNLAENYFSVIPGRHPPYIMIPCQVYQKRNAKFLLEQASCFSKCPALCQQEILLDKVPFICTRRFLQVVYIAQITQMEKVRFVLIIFLDATSWIHHRT
jgi:hypothetical protein